MGHSTVVSRKSTHARSTLQACQREGWVLFLVSTFNHERASMYAYNNSLPLNSLKYRTNNYIQWGGPVGLGSSSSSVASD